MENLTSHTINEATDYDYTFLFYNLLEKLKNDVPYFWIYDSFEQYYYVLNEALDFFSKKEDYSACEVIHRNLKNYLEKIPTSSEEAIKFLIDSTSQKIYDKISDTNTFSLAINLHQSTGMRIIDLWLLRYDESPLTRYYKENYNISNADEIANDIIVKYIEALKAKIELE